MEYDVIIIGTTIDRITSAIYLTKLGKKVLIIESNNLKDYVLSFEQVKDYTFKKYVSIDRWKDEIISYGGTIKDEDIIEIKDNEVFTDKEIYKAKAVIIATGKRHKLLGLDNEERYLGNGMHFCVLCDAPFYKNDIGCVVGSNNYSIKNALYLSKYCKEVFVIEESDKLKADEQLVKELSNKNGIKIYYNTKINEIIGESRIRKIVLNNNKMINIDCLFIGIGFISNIDVVGIEENNKNIFIVDCDKEEKDDDDGIKIGIKVMEYLKGLK